MASGAPGARRGPPPLRSSGGTWPRFPRRAPCDAPTRPVGAPCSADQIEVGFVGRPVRAGRAGWATRRSQAGPPRHDRRLVRELKREVSAATPPAWFNWAIREVRGGTWPHALDEAPQRPLSRTEPDTSTLPLIPARDSSLQRTARASVMRRRSNRSGRVERLDRPCSLHSPAADHAEPVRGWPTVAVPPCTRHLRPVPLARSRAASAAPRGKTGSGPPRIPHRCGSPPLAAARPAHCPPCPPSSREPRARPSIHLPPHSLSQGTARAPIPSMHRLRSQSRVQWRYIGVLVRGSAHPPWTTWRGCCCEWRSCTHAPPEHPYDASSLQSLVSCPLSTGAVACLRRRGPSGSYPARRCVAPRVPLAAARPPSRPLPTPPSPRPFSLSLSFSLLSLSQQPAAASTSVEKLAMLAQ